jgi:adenine-specific DNA-methyltransferase
VLSRESWYEYSYSPRLDPVLRFDATGASDNLPALLEKAKREPLTDAEARPLGEALRREEPWLEWAGKREANGFAVDPVAPDVGQARSSRDGDRPRTFYGRRYRSRHV